MGLTGLDYMNFHVFFIYISKYRSSPTRCFCQVAFGKYLQWFLCHLSSRDKYLTGFRFTSCSYEIKDAMLYRVASANDLQARRLGNC